MRADARRSEPRFPEPRRSIRCAVYTRKSTEEGLDMAFNSLEAQREACAAYVQSQRHEGWKLLPAVYDDGGFSGGSMERPALRQLMADIDAGKVDTVVVYKVDRLTRSLADFAKMVEVFDAKGVSFISVTQQFNTTTSMGRLTLNVLLSFAQFEREVTGERIRDKIAASRRKGMWMGGAIPLGYVVKDKKLVVEEREAKLVRSIYERYLALQSVDALKLELDKKGVRSKVRVSSKGNRRGGMSFSRGALYGILRNRHYVGEVVHRGESYPGQHEAIVDIGIWLRVQTSFAARQDERRARTGVMAPSLLTGLVYDQTGERLTPVHTNKKGQRYRYYVSPQATHRLDADRRGDIPPVRVPARDLEGLVVGQIRKLLGSPERLLDLIANAAEAAAGEDGTGPKTRMQEKHELLSRARHWIDQWPARATAEQRDFLLRGIDRVVVMDSAVEIAVSKSGIYAALMPPAGVKTSAHLFEEKNKEEGQRRPEDVLVLSVPAKLRRCGKAMQLVVAPEHTDPTAPREPVPALVNLIVKANAWYGRILSGEVTNQRQLSAECGREEAHVSRVLQCAFLAPDIVEAILGGHQSPGLTVEKLLSGLPMAWDAQRPVI